MTPEETRLQEAREATSRWRKWGPDLRERQWGTVREGTARMEMRGTTLPMTRLAPARITGARMVLPGSVMRSSSNASVGVWNGRDPILKERLFGLTNSESNHGKDVKEYYFYLDSTPTHSCMNYLYKYPQVAFPYNDLGSPGRTSLRP